MLWGSFLGGAAQGASRGMQLANDAERTRLAKEAMDMAKQEAERKRKEQDFQNETRKMMGDYVKGWQDRLTEQVPDATQQMSDAGEAPAMVSRRRRMNADEQRDFVEGMGSLMASRMKMDPREFQQLRTSLDRERDADADRAIRRLYAGEDPNLVLQDAPAKLRDRIRDGSVKVTKVPFKVGQGLPDMEDTVIEYEDRETGKPVQISALRYMMANASYDKLVKAHGDLAETGAKVKALDALTTAREAQAEASHSRANAADAEARKDDRTDPNLRAGGRGGSGGGETAAERTLKTKKQMLKDAGFSDEEAGAMAVLGSGAAMTPSQRARVEESVRKETNMAGAPKYKTDAEVEKEVEARIGRASRVLRQRPPAAAGGLPAPAAPKYREGQTATGPNGEKAVFRNGKWERQ